MNLLSANPFGSVNPPPEIAKYAANPSQGIGTLIDIVIKILIVGAGIYTLFNLVTAGYAFMAAGDDPKKVAGAWAKIWQSLLGLALTAGAFVLAAIFGKLLFGDAGFILKPTIPTLPTP